jgi:uncharacterized membrane protein
MDYLPAPGASSSPHATAHAHSLAVLLASNVPFAIIFGIFIAALVTMIVITLMWAVRRDRPGRAAWRQRQAERADAAERDLPPGPQR